MVEPGSENRISIKSLILVPAVITLAITILRLVGELQHWPEVLFRRSAGGGGAIIGIAWLPLILGPYFALKLAGAGERPKSAGKAIGLALLGLVVLVIAGVVGFAPQLQFPGKELVGAVLTVASFIVPVFGWSQLGKTLIAYAYSARIPVLIVMYFAMSGNWGTHYDAVAPQYKGSMEFWPKFWNLAASPQMFFWIAYTVIIGALLGGIAAAVSKRGKPAPQAATT